ncbi:MAG: inositol-phosphate phosphatase [Chloroflexi bacterium OLB15]|nr:MAG: inositol-phosphate phosphatase [Chloroflexi bacterium OLB15]
MDLSAIRAYAEQTAVLAGETAMRYFRQPQKIDTKRNIRDVVTEGDKASEGVILPRLREAYPQFGIMSEESGLKDVPDAEYFWHVDPIDGTTNFAAGLPHFSISIALADLAKRPLVGVVYDPCYKELFSAARGLGATLNGTAIHASGTPVLEQALLSSGFSVDRNGREIGNLSLWHDMLLHCRDLRRLGSAALDLAYVGAGRLDGYWERGLNSWDILAGILVAQEAGGRVTDYHGGEADLYGRGEVAATNGHIHAEVLAVMAEVEGH